MIIRCWSRYENYVRNCSFGRPLVFCDAVDLFCLRPLGFLTLTKMAAAPISLKEHETATLLFSATRWICFTDVVESSAPKATRRTADAILSGKLRCLSCSQQAASYRQNDVKTFCLDVSNAAAPETDTCVSPSLLLNKMENLWGPQLQWILQGLANQSAHAQASASQACQPPAIVTCWHILHFQSMPCMFGHTTMYACMYGWPLFKNMV